MLQKFNILGSILPTLITTELALLEGMPILLNILSSFLSAVYSIRTE